MLATEELYGSKLVAAMDRQHPRDLFDAWQMFASGGLSDATVECFVTYLQTFSKRRPADFEHQARALEAKLG